MQTDEEVGKVTMSTSFHQTVLMTLMHEFVTSKSPSEISSLFWRHDLKVLWPKIIKPQFCHLLDRIQNQTVLNIRQIESTGQIYNQLKELLSYLIIYR